MLNIFVIVCFIVHSWRNFKSYKISFEDGRAVFLSVVLMSFDPTIVIHSISRRQFEPHREKTGVLPMRKQRRISASQ